VFEPFAQWIIDDLSRAQEIGIGGDIGHATWAVLLPSTQDRDYKHRIPIRLV
jgi:hypothetical protein